MGNLGNVFKLVIDGILFWLGRKPPRFFLVGSDVLQLRSPAKLNRVSSGSSNLVGREAYPVGGASRLPVVSVR